MQYTDNPFDITNARHIQSDALYLKFSASDIATVCIYLNRIREECRGYSLYVDIELDDDLFFESVDLGQVLDCAFRDESNIIRVAIYANKSDMQTLTEGIVGGFYMYFAGDADDAVDYFHCIFIDPRNFVHTTDNPELVANAIHAHTIGTTRLSVAASKALVISGLINTIVVSYLDDTSLSWAEQVEFCNLLRIKGNTIVNFYFKLGDFRPLLGRHTVDSITGCLTDRNCVVSKILFEYSIPKDLNILRYLTHYPDDVLPIYKTNFDVVVCRHGDTFFSNAEITELRALIHAKAYFRNLEFDLNLSFIQNIGTALTRMYPYFTSRALSRSSNVQTLRTPLTTGAEYEAQLARKTIEAIVSTGVVARLGNRDDTLITMLPKDLLRVLRAFLV